MSERKNIEVIVGLLKIIQNPDKGACVNLKQWGILEEAHDIVFRSDESCQWCGGRGTVSDGAVCPECNGSCLRVEQGDS